MHLVKKIGVGHVDSSSKFKQTFYGKIRETQRGFNNFNLTRKISIYFVYFNFFPAVSPIIDWATGGLVNTKLEKSISKSTFGVQI